MNRLKALLKLFAIFFVTILVLGPVNGILQGNLNRGNIFQDAFFGSIGMIGFILVAVFVLYLYSRCKK